jgi:hypothetical protein
MKQPASVLVALLALVWGAGSAARAEVAAEVDGQGNYVRTVVFSNSSVRNSRVWGGPKEKLGYRNLNPAGDLNGDLWPLIVDQTAHERKPWVLWSRYNGSDFDLAWSTFESGSWREVSWLEGAPAEAGDDLDPDAEFDTDGRPHVVWWRNEGGVGRVYLSVFLVTRWMPAFRVSDPSIDSVHPTITLLPDGKIEVAFDTPGGRVVRVVAFGRPLTITDDVTPFGRMTVTEERPENSLSN